VADDWNLAAAEKRVQKVVGDLAVPWDSLHCGTKDVEEGNLVNLSLKLAYISHHIVRVNNLLTMLLAQRTLRRETLDQALDRRLAEPGDGKRMAKDVKRAALIHNSPQLRQLKIDVMEGMATIEALGMVKDSLDVLWRTASRIISARLREPIE